jgi:hypothetical protein
MAIPALSLVGFLSKSALALLLVLTPGLAVAILMPLRR